MAGATADLPLPFKRELSVCRMIVSMERFSRWKRRNGRRDGCIGRKTETVDSAVSYKLSTVMSPGKRNYVDSDCVAFCGIMRHTTCHRLATDATVRHVHCRVGGSLPAEMRSIKKFTRLEPPRCRFTAVFVENCSYRKL